MANDSFQDRINALDALGDAPQPRPVRTEEPVVDWDVKEQTAKQERKKRERQKEEKGAPRRGFAGILNGDVFRSQALIRQVPLIALIIFYFSLFIANRYRVEDLAKEREALTKKIDFLREHQIQMQTQYQKTITISEIAKALDSTGVGIIGGPPYEL